MLCLGIVISEAGFWGAVFAFLLFPVMVAVAPWYAALAYGDWTAIAVVYGGAVVGALFLSIGNAIAGDDS